MFSNRTAGNAKPTETRICGFGPCKTVVGRIQEISRDVGWQTGLCISAEAFHLEAVIAGLHKAEPGRTFRPKMVFNRRLP